MTPSEFGLFFISILASIAGQFLLKAGALKLAAINGNNLLSLILGIATTAELVAGLACYGIGAFTYILVLRRVNLSVAAPAVSLGYVVSVLLGYYVFREAIPISRAVGLGLIVCGVVLVIWKS